MNWKITWLCYFKFQFHCWKFFLFFILKLNDVIKMIWIDSKKPITKNLKTNLKIWKKWILYVLTYLIIHNFLYKNVVLNHEMLNKWFSIFIFSKLQDNIIYINNNNYDEHQKYSHNFQNKNLKMNCKKISQTS